MLVEKKLSQSFGNKFCKQYVWEETHSFFLDPNEQQIQFLATHTGKLKLLKERLPSIAHLLYDEKEENLFEIPLIVDSHFYIKNWGSLRVPPEARDLVLASNNNIYSDISKIFVEKDIYHYWKVIIQLKYKEKVRDFHKIKNNKKFYHQYLLRKLNRKKYGSNNYKKIFNKMMKIFKELQ